MRSRRTERPGRIAVDPNDRGFALIVAILVSATILALGVVALGLAVHNEGASGMERTRAQAVHAAEAGIDAMFSLLQRTAPANLPCSLAADLATTPVAHYTVSLGYYAASGTQLACPLTAPPATVEISSVGSARTAFRRTMESEVRLTPVYGGTGFAIFSDRDMTFHNKLTLLGHVGNDANIYTNGGWACAGYSHSLQGSVVAQGAISMNGGCSLLQDATAVGALSMNGNSAVSHDATSSTSSLAMAGSSSVTHNATAATTCTGCAGRVGGTITENHVSPLPPAFPFPAISFDPAAWTASGYLVVPFSSCSDAAAYLKFNLTAVPTVVRISPACTLNLSFSTVTALQNLAIVTDGPITVGTATTFKSLLSPWAVFFIVTNGAGCSGASPANFSTASTAAFSNVSVYVNTPCTATLGNSTLGVGGQVYAGQVVINNLFSMSFLPISVPGAGLVTGFQEDIVYVREVVNR